MPRRFDWHDEKNTSNWADHGLSFEEATGIFAGPVFTAPAKDKDGEARFISYGRLADDVVIAVVHTERDGLTRLISARPAKRKERSAYYAHLGKTTKGN